ncbi:MAG TPA: fatty acid--CoA ligase family protein, partial [Ilumatobacteraceae bacterium]
TAPAIAIVGDGIADRIGAIDGLQLVSRAELLAICAADSEPELPPLLTDSAEEIAVLLFTSGTTGEPKAAVLRHSNLTSYILGTVEFAGADPDDAALVSVPPYHIAGVSAILSSVFSGRRLVYLESFDPAQWVDTAITERITHAMVVPTMLGRILDELERRKTSLPALRALSYGGGPMPQALVERALIALPNVDFVNAYGLTETASTISVLGPDDHRTAIASDDPAVRRRLSSVGRPIDSVELTVRGLDGEVLGPNERGEIWVRGDQVSGQYVGRDDRTDGWFHTRDAGEFDDAGYLYVHGRLDDVIVRGGENLSPGEIEYALLEYPGVVDAAVVGIPDAEWGERVVAAVVLDEDADVEESALRDHVRAKLRSTKTPERVQFRDALPMNETGKLLRRVLREELAAEFNPQR